MVTKKIKITIKTLEESFKEFKDFARNLDKGIIKKQTPELSFVNFETFKRFLTQKRLELLSIIKSTKPKSINDLANKVQRDFKNVYEDIKILDTLGLIKMKKTNSGIMPIVVYDELDLKIPLKIRA